MPGYRDSTSNITWGYSNGESGYGNALNRNFRQLAYIGTHKAIISTIATPPTTPAQGDMYLVAATPTGAWSSYNENDIVVYGRDENTPTTVAWQRYTPRVGMRFYHIGLGRSQVYDGSVWKND